MFAEEDLKEREMELLVRKYSLDMKDDVTDQPLSLRYEKAIKSLETELAELEAEMIKVSAL